MAGQTDRWQQAELRIWLFVIIRGSAGKQAEAEKKNGTIGAAVQQVNGSMRERYCQGGGGESKREEANGQG